MTTGKADRGSEASQVGEIDIVMVEPITVYLAPDAAVACGPSSATTAGTLWVDTDIGGITATLAPFDTKSKPPASLATASAPLSLKL